MITNNLGYCFECHKDGFGQIGVKEFYKIMFKDNIQRVYLTTAIDNYANIVIPYNCNQSLGFKSLSESCKTTDDIIMFTKSNKPYYSKLDEIAMIASGSISFNKDTGEVASVEDFGFYVPKTVSDNVKECVDTRGNQQPALICEKLSVSKGLNLFPVSQQIYDSYFQNFLKQVSAKSTLDKISFLSSILLKE